MNRILAKHEFFTDILGGYPLAIKQLAGALASLSFRDLIEKYQKLRQHRTSIEIESKNHELRQIYVSMLGSLDEVARSEPNALTLYLLICLLPDGLSKFEFEEMLEFMDCHCPDGNFACQCIRGALFDFVHTAHLLVQRCIIQKR